MRTFHHSTDPLSSSEWAALQRVVTAVGNSTVARCFIDITVPAGAGSQTVPIDTMIGITEGYRGGVAQAGEPVRLRARRSNIVPIISKDFIVHWRDVLEGRVTGHGFPLAKAAAAAASVARSEDKLVLYGHSPLGYHGLMTVEGRNLLSDLQWSDPGDAYRNFITATEVLMAKGYNGPFAAVLHPGLYAGMHRVLRGSSLLEIAHVKALLTGGVFRSSLLAPRTGLVVATGRQNFELYVSIDTSAAFLGARRMNLPFRVFKAVYLRILRPDAICSF